MQRVDQLSAESAQATSHEADRALVARSLRERAARDELVERLRCVPRMLAAKNALMGRPVDDNELDDLAQETVLTVWRKRADYEGRASFESWVFSFCYHQLMNRVRARSRELRPLEDSPEPVAGSPVDTDEHGHVHKALARLEPEERELMRLKHFDDLSFSEIGRRLDVSPNTLKARYYRAADRLRTLLRREHGEGR